MPALQQADAPARRHAGGRGPLSRRGTTNAGPGAAAAPLRRNRDFLLLQGGQLLSATGSESTLVVYPLLVLAATGSPASAGVVAFAQLVPFALFGLVAGVVADRFDRRAVMLAADGARAVAAACLAATILLDHLALWQVLAVAFVDGAGSAFFHPAASGALRSVVPAVQLPAAAGVQQGRAAAVQIAGPPLGGALFALGRAVPFLADVVSYGCSAVSLLAMRTPFQERREPERVRLRARMAEGFGFLWRQPFVRTTTFLYALTNFIGPGLLLAVVAVGREQGLASGRIGLLLASLGVCVLVGSIASPLLRRALSTRAILLLELWLWPASVLFVVWPDVYVLMASMLPAAVAIPVTDSVVIGHRLAITPDRLVGRVESVRASLAQLVAPFGPLTAGLLLGAATQRVAIAAFTMLAVVLAVWGTLSPAIRDAPSLRAHPPALAFRANLDPEDE